MLSRYAPITDAAQVPLWQAALEAAGFVLLVGVVFTLIVWAGSKLDPVRRARARIIHELNREVLETIADRDARRVREDQARYDELRQLIAHHGVHAEWMDRRLTELTEDTH